MALIAFFSFVRPSLSKSKVWNKKKMIIQF